MIVERTAVKKSLAVTLILAIGLSLPGSAAWSQTYNARVSPVTPVAGAQSAAALSGAPIGGSLVPSLSLNSLSVSALAPVLSAPAVTPAALAAVPVAARAASAPTVARPIASPLALSAKVGATAPSAEASGRAQLDTLSRVAGESAAETGDIKVVALGRVFDGSTASDSSVRSDSFVDQRGLSGRSVRPSLAPNLTRGLTAAPAAASPTQKKMVQTLYQVASIFAEQYAPLDMNRFKLDLKQQYDKAKAGHPGRSGHHHPPVPGPPGRAGGVHARLSREHLLPLHGELQASLSSGRR